MLKSSGLSAAMFSSSSASPWDQYPTAGLMLKIWGVGALAAESTLSPFYPTDASVEADAGIQAWVAAMLAPLGGNLRQLNALNAITTRAELFDVAGCLLSIGMFHGFTYLQDYTVSALSMAHLPPSLNVSRLPDPTANFSVAQLVSAITNTNIYGLQATFVFAFNGAKPWTQLVPGTLNLTSGAVSNANFSGDPLYLWGAPSAVAAANAGVAQFRKNITSLYSNTDQSLLRQMSTNWGAPSFFPRAIEL